MWIGTAVAALICLVYWIILLFYSGMNTGFMMFWLIAAIILASASVWTWMKKKGKLRVQFPLWIKVPCCTILLFFLTVFIISEVFIVTGMINTPPSAMDYLIVLGNYEYGNKNEDILIQRLDCALGYLEKNNNTMVVVSGGTGEDSYISQAKVMYDYLVLKGISSNRIIMERRSQNTSQSIYYSRLLMEEEGDSVGIVTSNYNGYRAVGIAKKAGFSQVYGITAPMDWILFPDMMVRECFTVFIEKLRGNL